MQITDFYKIFIKYPKISTDTRTIEKGNIFFALKGDNFDGNKYIKVANNSGASYIVTDDLSNKDKKNCIYVSNSLSFLQDLAKYHRKQLTIPIIAITGTNGKTTTKELTFQVLKQKYNVKATIGNFNNHIGVPLTLLSFNNKTEIGIVEMGANHPKEIEFLCNIAKPNFGIITNIGKAHLEGFGDFDGLINTKAELYKAILDNNGQVFINDDNKLLKSIIKNQRTISYGTNNNTFCIGELISANPFVKFKIGENIIQSNLIGTYNFENLLAASCVGKYFNIEIEKIKEALENYIPTNNRSQVIKKGSCNIILDAYNANPTSISLAIDNFENIDANKKVLILGDMFELGEYAETEHNTIIKKLSNIVHQNSEIRIFLAGKNFNKLNNNEKITSFNTSEELINHISKIEFNNTWFLVKGSRGMKLESVLENINFS